MSHVKQDILRLLQSLPDDCTLEEIQYHLYVRQKIERRPDGHRRETHGVARGG